MVAMHFIVLRKLVLIILLLFAEQGQCFRCLKGEETAEHDTFIRSIALGLQVSNRATHQVMTRIFYLFLREVLYYKDVQIIPSIYTNLSNPHYYFLTMDAIRWNPTFPELNIIDLEVWTPYEAYKWRPDNLSEAGPSLTPGRFGWFVPKTQISMYTNSTYSLYYEVFRDMNNPHYQLYVNDNELIDKLLEANSVRNYTNPLCMGKKCATLIAEHHNDTSFIIDQLNETQSYVNVLWLGDNFRKTISTLYKMYAKYYAESSKRFIVLHWTPSEIIDAEIKFTQITMPRCEDFRSLQEAECKYELTSILKYYVNDIRRDRVLMHALREFFMNRQDLEFIQKELSIQRERYNSTEDIYNHVACNWLLSNSKTYVKWVNKDQTTLWIGAILPFNMSSRGHEHLEGAVNEAVNAVNRNTSLLPGYRLGVMINDGQCKSDMVMKAFIHYFSIPHLLGVLGPACTETVEPIAGISKHMNMMVISYSAEGAVDRYAYPYFYRTIGSNSQYEDAYMDIMRKLNWRQVAALTEDGQKYTEYISRMENMLKKNNFKLIANRKFPSDVTGEAMRTHLLELKKARAKIIIADIQMRNAAIALCEAKKLKMTLREDYVWFLPSWIKKDFVEWQILVNNSCTAEELREAVEGHFSIMHTPYGKPDALMQEGITVEEWLEAYRTNHSTFSNFVGFAYDAVWTYAYAASKLLQWDKNVFGNLRSNEVVAEKFSEILWETNFEGLSGQVSFPRVIDLDILQWRNSSYVGVGKYVYVQTSDTYNKDSPHGQLHFDYDKVHWFNQRVPEDGKYDCKFSSLARLLDVNCDTASIIFSILMCMLAVICVSLISFWFWKQRYDSKLRRSAKIMKTFGIDLLSPSRSNSNTLDKWEIPKENVVVNRRLGEGAFGTVYGGEAQLGSGDWTAVAVKTLKSGASTEDRLDFLAEAEAMKRFDHKNIIKLLAVCLQNEPIYTIMEFMLYGDLKTYLLARRNMVNERTSEESDISPKRLTMYAMDVVRGLSYLAEQKYVHRDLACRNCLVNAQRVVKIGDFGMARPVFESDYYRFNRKGMLPVRWMAPESLALGLFTPASDIWAFGVVLYEMISFGSYPYQGLTNNQVLDYVKNGNTLHIPCGVKPQLEGLLKACWSQESTKRPTALEVIEYISNYPRLLTPSLDFPGSAVEMPETESDQLELLPKPRKPSPQKGNSTLDILAPMQTNGSTKLEHNFIGDLNQLELTNSEAGPDVTGKPATISPITPDGYSVMSPLLMVCDKFDSSQGHLIKNLPSDSI